MEINGKRIAVLGAGIGGLTSAYYLARAGHRPIVFEASERLGGLGTHFEHEGQVLDRFYHVLLDSDHDLLGLLDELGVTDRLIWKETGMGFHVGGSLYGFNTPLDLLRFGAVPFLDRIRVGLGALYATRVKRNATDLDDRQAVDWLREVFGERVLQRLWIPLLRAKFGDRLDRVPAYWVWNTLNREKNGSQEVKGYLREGFPGLATRLREAIEKLGGEVRLQSQVQRMAAENGSVDLTVGNETETYAAALSTLPLPLLSKVSEGSLTAAIPLPSLDYQGVVNAIVVSKKPLERYYWTAVVEDDFPFQGVVETTHVIPSESIGDRHLFYLMNYCDADSETYARSDDAVAQQAVDGLQSLYTTFDPKDVEATYVFRAPHVEPVWTVGYLRERPAHRIGDSHVYLSTTAQAYPRVTAWNTSIGLARDATDTLLQDIGAPT